MNRTIFLDKDGTLVKDIPYNIDPAYLELTPHALEALAVLQEAGFRLVIVTNQSGIARGLFTEEDLRHLQLEIERILDDAGIRLDGFYYCPHYPDGKVLKYSLACDCRKPAPGLLLQAARELEIDRARSWLIGDILNDVEAGHRAGCRSILINNGNETEWQLTAVRRPDFTAADLLEAAGHILSCDA
jgi:D-glycero-D-manno-heptose 1,7-bisphosphate phosphatase